LSEVKYRPDIDGLRALAVVPVVLYHLKVKPFDGGFVGVDVFFVISGYLITQLIYGEIQQGRYSIVGFYVRRARRIFPALFVMCAVCSAVLLATFLPGEIAEFRSSLIAATLFVSNIYFYITNDYFAAAAETKPLLHTWSLAVEEQFYIFFPLVLLATHRYLLRWQHQSLIAIAVGSLAICTWLAEYNPSAAFYLIHPRAWELLTGALLAIGVVPAIENRWLAEALGALGLVLIALAIFALTEGTHYLGVAII
jgi:peptidoglycan/LPS O-acetylase OafA/YrhL